MLLLEATVAVVDEYSASAAASHTATYSHARWEIASAMANVRRRCNLDNVDVRRVIMVDGATGLTEG